MPKADDTHRRVVGDTSTIELAPCPFCASTNLGFYEHVYAQQFGVACNLCGAEGPQRSLQDEEVKLWNRRVQA
jgi:Lar family restriction alleviation protein